jgi:small-conductance mechanosensitive channel
VDLLGIHWFGLTEENGRRLILSVAFVVAIALTRSVSHHLARPFLRGETNKALQKRFWTHQGINLVSALLVVFGLLSIWFDDPARLAPALGLVSAGLAFALQRVVTAFAGYIVILRGNNFTVGDRISMGGVRGDVLALGFMQTTIMEMGVAPGSDAGPSVWVKSRQFTGRIVTVTNAKIFDDPVYNYTRDFPYIWEEMSVPIRYGDDRARAEVILLEAARRHAIDPAAISEEAARGLEQRFDLRRLDFEPKVFYRLTSNC